MAEGSWSLVDSWRTVPDPMPMHARYTRGRDGGCHTKGPDQMTCHRPAGHTGRHLAVSFDHSAGSYRFTLPGVIVGVWGDPR